MPYRATPLQGTGPPATDRVGQPPAAKVVNAHEAACHCCGIIEAIAWFWAIPDDGSPLEPLRPYRWFCSGEGISSGGTRRCSSLARKIGAVPWVNNFNPRSPYDTLGIAADATMAEIRTAYLRASRVHHPDKAGNTDEATRNFQEINSAFDILKLDREGQAQAAPEAGQEDPEEEDEDEEEDFDDEDDEEDEEDDEDRGAQAEEVQPEEEEQEQAAPDPTRSRGTPRPAAPRQPRQPRSPRCPAYASEPAQGAKVRRVWSITITPTKPACRLIAPNDEEKLQCCQENTVLLGQLFAELMLYDAVCVYHFGLERGHD